MKYDSETIENASWISLSDYEEVRAWSHSSIYPYIPIFVMSILMVFAGILGPFMFETTSIVTWSILSLAPLGLLMIGLEYLKYASVFYVFTDDRVFRKKGILNHKTRSVGYDAIDKVKTEQSIIGRILKFGDMIIVTATPSDEDILLSYVPDLNESNNIVSDYTGYQASRRKSEDIENKNYREDN